MNWIYEIITDILKESPKTRQKWTTAFDQLNNFLVSDNHITSIKTLFSVDTITKENNKLSSKLAFWLMDKLIENEAKKVQQTQEEELHQETPPPQLSQAAKGKIRYIAGACVNKIGTRLQKSVVSKLSQCTAKSKISRKLDYRKQRMLKTFRINESEVDDSEPSMAEIDFKQGLSHGLYVVSDDVFNFFIKLHDVVQSTITVAQFHLHFDNIHLNCRSAVDASDLLLDKWIDLFGEIDDTQMEDEIFLNLVMELYKDITEYFLKVSIAEALKNFKATVPRKKKQALRVKLTALGEKKNPKKQKLEEINTEQASYICHLCNEICDWDPAEIGDESIACDTCNCWSHYKCVDIEGTETFLKRKNAKWYCPNCFKGKGKGKGRGEKK
ncbi:hypothetical protein KP79_PYT04964 [Mizuhopecten yessoensis]|uniref:PHD-type domain-containing protein n=1 Tax=Mizuhopecten yessoensis TaxID=6573 RepID=A0A210Q2U9_MIZYE|nr:hypothetical protein KP79_PYT04964 [Mizuhopecten yessoensis]